MENELTEAVKEEKRRILRQMIIKSVCALIFSFMFIFITAGNKIDLQAILIVGIFVCGMMALIIFWAYKERTKNIVLMCQSKMETDPSNEKARFDEYARTLRKTPAGYRMNSFLILARYGKWPIFLLFLWGAYHFYSNRMWHNVIFTCFLTVLWFPLIDKLFSKKVDFFVMFGIKIMITICAVFLMKIIQAHYASIH